MIVLKSHKDRPRNDGSDALSQPMDWGILCSESNAAGMQEPSHGVGRGALSPRPAILRTLL